MNFTERDPKPPSRTDRRSRAWFQTLLLVAVIVALVLGVVFYYRAHLFWRFFASSQGLTDVSAVPISEMPDESIPKGWVACRFGALYFSVPPDLAKNRQEAPNGTSILALGEDSRSMIIALPTSAAEVSSYLRADMEMPPEGQSLSLIRLRLVCLQADVDDFRWSMSPREVHWLAWRLTMGRLFRTGSIQWAETLFRDDLEGIAYYRPKHVEFEWQSTDGRAGGYIHFVVKSEEREIKPGWVRAVCRSLKFSGQCFPDQMPQDEVKAQFQAINE